MENIFEVLEYAISDIGIWSWWVEKFPHAIQLEFRAVMLWNPPLGDNQPPSGQIALKFINPTHVSFLKRKSEHSIDENWYELLNEDKIEPFTIDRDSFVINDKERAKSILSEVDKTDLYFGKSFDESLFESKCFICFWAGIVGILVCSEEMELYNHSGKVELVEVPKMSQKWWSYWKEYWSKMDTENKLPYDFACEVTIPMKDLNNE